MNVVASKQLSAQQMYFMEVDLNSDLGVTASSDRRNGHAVLRKSEDVQPSSNENTQFRASVKTETIKAASDSHTGAVLFGYDLSHHSATTQFLICSGGAFIFTIVYGYLQELLSVHVAGRRFALFLAVCQFAGYAFWSFLLTNLKTTTNTKHSVPKSATTNPPWVKFIALSLLRAFDLAMTNMAMQFLNYPAKTLIKSSRIVFTMFLGVVIQKKRYSSRDYMVVGALVLGLAIFLHADSNSNAVFHPLGVLFLVLSLLGDGTINNWSEKLMEQHSMSQDQYHFRLYSIAFAATVVAAFLNDELAEGIRCFLLQPGTITEIESNSVEGTQWSVTRKAMVLILFSASGIFGASCLGAITKRFGALTMALTSTARKATTLFVSIAMFNNSCTIEHLAGISLFVGSLVLKSVSGNKKNQGNSSGVDKEKWNICGDRLPDILHTMREKLQHGNSIRTKRISSSSSFDTESTTTDDLTSNDSMTFYDSDSYDAEIGTTNQK